MPQCNVYGYTLGEKHIRQSYFSILEVSQEFIGHFECCYAQQKSDSKDTWQGIIFQLVVKQILFTSKWNQISIICHLLTNFIDINNLFSRVIIKWSNLLPSNPLHMRLCTFDIYTTSPVYQTPCALWLYHKAFGLAFYWDSKPDFVLLCRLIYLTHEMTNWIMIFRKKDSDYRKKTCNLFILQIFPILTYMYAEIWYMFYIIWHITLCIIGI